MNDLIIFLHIPKTGGTSLRASITNAVDVNSMLFIYGQGNVESIHQHRSVRGHPEEGYFRRVAKLVDEDDEVKLLFGHLVPEIGYIKSRNCRYFTMVRDPYDRIMSLYHHHLRHFGIGDVSFEEWIKSDRVKNQVFDFNEEFKRYEKVFLYENYTQALLEFAGVLGLDEIQEYRRNDCLKLYDRSPETDALVDEYFSKEVEMYQYFLTKSK